MTTRPSASLNEDQLRSLSHAQGEPEWLLQRRLEASRAYSALAMPNPLDEEWRRTDLSGFDLEAALDATPTQRAPTDVLDDEGYGGRIAQVGSDYVSASRADLLPESVLFMDLHQAAQEQPELVQRYLHSLVPPTEWKLTALQAASWRGGAFVYVPKGVEVTLPLRYALASDGSALLPHLLVIADEQSSVRIVQEGVSGAGEAGQALVSGTVEIICKPYAKVRYVDVARWGDNVYAFSTIRAHLDRGAELTAALVGLGGRVVRTRLEALLAGEGSSADLLGLSYGRGAQHFSYLTLQDHIAPRTRSDLLFKAALTDTASEVWYGTVRVGKGASQSDANQASRNLLLSDHAKAAPIPVLEIEAYDILRCSHGATAGPLDEEQRFYLESRGVNPVDAQRLLVEAFFTEVVDKLPVRDVRDRVASLLGIERSA